MTREAHLADIIAHWQAKHLQDCRALNPALTADEALERFEVCDRNDQVWDSPNPHLAERAYVLVERVLATGAYRLVAFDTLEELEHRYGQLEDVISGSYAYLPWRAYRLEDGAEYRIKLQLVPQEGAHP